MSVSGPVVGEVEAWDERLAGLRNPPGRITHLAVLVGRIGFDVPVTTTGPNPTLSTVGSVETVLVIEGVSVANLTNHILELISVEVLNRLQLTPPSGLQYLRLAYGSSSRAS